MESVSGADPASILTARDVMSSKVLSVTVTATTRQIARILVENGISGVPVVDGDGLPVGMVTEGDLIGPDADGEGVGEGWLAQLAGGEPLSARMDRSERTARDIMASPVVTVAEVTELPEIARLMTSYRIKRLPVVRDGRVVGIVSRADLVRRIAEAPAKPPPASHHVGFLSEALANLEEHFAQRHPSSPASATDAAPGEATVTAEAFRALMETFVHNKATQDDEERRVGAERRKAMIKDLIDHHVKDETWRDILHRATIAAEAGLEELLVLRFPCGLCGDGGRAINSSLPEWPGTLRGEAAEIYLRWERDLRPNGFHLVAKVLDFSEGIPGDIGLILVWGEEQTAAARDGSATKK